MSSQDTENTEKQTIDEAVDTLNESMEEAEKKIDDVLDDNEQRPDDQEIFYDPAGLLTNFVFNNATRVQGGSFIGGMVSMFREGNVRSQFEILKSQAEAMLQKDYEFKVEMDKINQLHAIQREFVLAAEADAKAFYGDKYEVGKGLPEGNEYLSSRTIALQERAMKATIEDLQRKYEGSNEIDVTGPEISKRAQSAVYYSGSAPLPPVPDVALERELIKIRRSGSYPVAGGEPIDVSGASLNQILGLHKKFAADNPNDPIIKLAHAVENPTHPILLETKMHNDSMSKMAAEYAQSANKYVALSDKFGTDFAGGLSEMNEHFVKHMRKNNAENIPDRGAIQKFTEQIEQMTSKLLASLGLKR